MNALVQVLRAELLREPCRVGSRWIGTALIAVLLFVLGTYDIELGDAILRSLIDAYFQVTTFVAATLLVFAWLEHRLGQDTGTLLARYDSWQIPLAACLGALPGCGGAIIIVTQYVLGRMRFSAVIAVLTATMGDAAFLVLARAPLTGLLMIALGVSVGIISGYASHFLFGKDFMHRKLPVSQLTKKLATSAPLNPLGKAVDYIWGALLIPGLILAFLIAFQYDFGSWQTLVDKLGLVAISLALIMWAASGHVMANRLSSQPQSRPLARVANDTNFVTAWVVVAFLSYELMEKGLGLNFGAIASAAQPVLPLLATLIGFLPGCGPQVLVANLHVDNMLPLSALIANAISNDGDALLPAIALAPRAAFLATFISAFPALIIGYVFYGFGL